MISTLFPYTTLFRSTIYINDREIKAYNIHELRWNIGYVLQEIALFPHLTIAENIAVVPEMKKWKRVDIRKRTQELLAMVGLDPETYYKRMPNELSGGEQQRVRSEEHTSELQSRGHLVCRLLLEKKNKHN